MLNCYEKNLTDTSVEYYENKKQKNKHIIKIFKTDLNRLLKYGLTPNNLKEFYFSCNALGMGVYPTCNDLENWIDEGLNEKLS
jgi:hypothetical protein